MVTRTRLAIPEGMCLALAPRPRSGDPAWRDRAISHFCDVEFPMKISVIGCGYLGAVHAASMAQLGHDVVGIDVDERKVAALSQARAPFFEPGFEELLERTLASGRLSFSADIAAAAGSQVHFV